jgi:hypothetical protein
LISDRKSLFHAGDNDFILRAKLTVSGSAISDQKKSLLRQREEWAEIGLDDN